MWRKLNKLHIIIGAICFDKKSWGQRQQSNQALQAMMNNINYMQIWLCYPSSQGESADVKIFWSRGSPYNGLNWEATPERRTFFRLQVYERVGISLVKYMEG